MSFEAYSFEVKIQINGKPICVKSAHALSRAIMSAQYLEYAIR